MCPAAAAPLHGIGGGAGGPAGGRDGVGQPRRACRLQAALPAALKAKPVPGTVDSWPSEGVPWTLRTQKALQCHPRALGPKAQG